MRHRFFDVPIPTIIGHRGAAGSAPENTIAAFERALELGAQILESDIHVTRDAVPVLIHDPTVDRVSQGRGQVRDMTLDELREFDAGHRFSIDGGNTFPMRGKGLVVPTLEECFAAFPSARFNLEIKDAAAGLVERVVQLVAEFDRADLTLLAAGEDPIMLELREVLAQSEVAPAIGASTGDVGAILVAMNAGEAAPEAAMALQIPPEFAGRALITSELVAYAHAADIVVHAWTINDPEEMRRLLKLGVDGIITDYPERMAEVLRRP